MKSLSIVVVISIGGIIGADIGIQIGVISSSIGVVRRNREGVVRSY